MDVQALNYLDITGLVLSNNQFSYLGEQGRLQKFVRGGGGIIDMKNYYRKRYISNFVIFKPYRQRLITKHSVIMRAAVKHGLKQITILNYTFKSSWRIFGTSLKISWYNLK